MSVNVGSSQRDDDTRKLRLAAVADRADVAEETDQRFVFAFFDKSLSFATRYKYDLKNERNSELFLNIENAPNISFAVLKEEEGKLSIYVTGREKKVLESGDKFVIERANFGDADMPTRTVVVYQGEGVFIIGVEHAKDDKSLKVVKNGDRRILEENQFLQVFEVSDLVNKTHEQLVPILNTTGGGELPFATVEEGTVIDEFSPVEKRLFTEIEKLTGMFAAQEEKFAAQNEIIAALNEKIAAQNAEIAAQGEKFKGMYSDLADSLVPLAGDVGAILKRLGIQGEANSADEDLEGSDSENKQVA